MARAAVVVAGRRLNRQIHVPELFVRRHRRPDGDVAGVGPRIVQPGLVPELPRRRHGVERPQQLPGADVEAADVGGRGLHPRARGLVDDVHHAAGHAPDDDDVAHDGGRAAPPVPAEGRAAVALGEIDGAVRPEVGVALSGLRVQRDQEPAGDRDDPFVFAVGPIGQPPRRAAGVLLRRRIEPDDFAARRVERGDGPERRAHVQKAAHLQRRVLIGARGPGVGPHFLHGQRQRGLTPGDAKTLHRVLVDLIERRVLRTGVGRAVGRPVRRGPGRLRSQEATAQHGERCRRERNLQKRSGHDQPLRSVRERASKKRAARR